MASKPDEALKEHVLDMLSGMGGVTSKFMFGGWGFSQKGTFFGLIAGGTLYFTVDDVTRPAYEARGGEPFMYSRDGKSTTMGYLSVPDDALEDRDALIVLAKEAVATKLRVKAKGPKKASRKKV